MTIKIESHDEWAERVRAERDEPRKGVFAHSPDPIVFGPDKLRFSTLSSVDFELDSRYYIGTYRRSDYPDWPHIW
jgi:hypothetical protein